MLHKKVQVWIFSKTPSGEPLCLLLKTNQARGAFWQPVTGSVEPNEGFFEAACREPNEETGFSFDTSPIDTGFEFAFISHVGNARERIYGLYVADAPTPRLDPIEHDAFQWLAPTLALPLLKFSSNIDGLKRSYRLIFEKDL